MNTTRPAPLRRAPARPRFPGRVLSTGAMLLVVLAPPALAQVQVQVQFDELGPPRLSDHAAGTSHLAVGDLDLDGDVDVVVADRSLHLWIHFNDGRGHFVESPANPITDYARTLTLSDLDGDGDLDIAVPPVLLSNDGQGNFQETLPRLSWQIGLLGLPSAVGAADLDGDGDVDLVVSWLSLSAAGLSMFRNDGHGHFAAAPMMAPNQGIAGGTNHLAIGDVDGDGAADILLAAASGGYPVTAYYRNRLLLNDGTGLFTNATRTHMPTTVDWSVGGIALGDVDGNGSLDLALGSSWSSGSPGGQNRLLLNDGHGTFTDATSTHLPHAEDSTSSLAMSDVDEDGDLDLLAGNDGHDHLLLNDGTGRFTDATSRLLADAAPTRAVACADLDGDGDPDLVFGNDSDDRIYLNLLRHLDAPTAPTIGQVHRLDVYSRFAPAGSTSLAFVALSAGPAAIDLGPLGTLGLDPASMLHLPPALIGPTGSTSIEWTIPDRPDLTGLDLHGQALVWPVPFAPHLTQVVRDTVR